MMIRFSPPSEFTAGVSPVGPPEGRLSEKSPAVPAGFAKADCFIPSKAIVSGTNSIGRGPVGLGGVSADRPAGGARGTGADLYRSMKRFSNASKRFLISASSALESGKLAQSLFDIFAVGFLAAFASLLGLSIVGSFVILFVGLH